MGYLAVYILKSALLLALMVSLFMLFMSKETFHRINRYTMLLLILLSLTIPFVNLGVDTPLTGAFTAIEDGFTEKRHIVRTEVSVPVVSEEIAVQESDSPVAFVELLPEAYDLGELPLIDFPVEEAAPEQVQKSEVKERVTIEKIPLWIQAFAVIYVIGVLFLVIRLAVMYFQVVRIIMRSRVVDASLYGCNGIRLRVHNGSEKPFSWFRWVVVSEDDLEEGAHEILIHETAHARAGHSWDIILADAVIMMQWFNPLAWMMKGCLKDIHEFEADEAVINSGVNARQYQLLIIKKAVGARLYSIANSFNHSLTKKRITMMCKEKSKKWSRAKALYMLPVAAIAALSFSSVESANAGQQDKGNEFAVNSTNSDVENLPVYDAPSIEVKELQSSQEYPKDTTSAGEPVKVYDAVEEKPEFPGGMDELAKWLRNNIKYPQVARGAGLQGRISVKFTIGKDGGISNAEIHSSQYEIWYYGEEAEALRAKLNMARHKLEELVAKGASEVEIMEQSKLIAKYNAQFENAVKNSSPRLGKLDADGSYLEKSLEAEALRVVSSMPKWKPGTTDGKPVDVQFNLPIVFRLPKESAIRLNGSDSKETMRVIAGGTMVLPSHADASIFIDGKLYEGSLDEITPEKIESITVIKIDQLTTEEIERFKAKGKNGVVFINSKKQTEELSFNQGFTAGGKPVNVVDERPEFPGELYVWLTRNIKYPKAARDLNVQGRVYVRFVVKADGSIANARVVENQTTSKYGNASNVEYCKQKVEEQNRLLSHFEDITKQFEANIAKYEKQYEILAKDNASEAVLKRRREELESAYAHLNEEKERIDYLRSELKKAQQELANAQNELDEVVVVAYNNGDKASPAPEKQLKAAVKSLDDEAIRLFNSMPKWKPGTKDGKPVDVELTLPLSFHLQ